jgi:MFS family permease
LAFINRLLQLPLSLFRSAVPVPLKSRNTFRNLYLDVGWYGLLNGSILQFVTVYLARLGASGTEIGLINAAPAVANLIFALPVGRWLKGRRLEDAVFVSSVLQRLFYIPLILIPLFLPDGAQIWVAIILTLVMSIPGTAVVVGFNSMFADLVMPIWRGYVAGVRNALLSIVSTVTTLICGWLLVTVRFPTGYQVVFTIGLLGGIMSSVSLFLIAREGQPKRPLKTYFMGKAGNGLSRLDQTDALNSPGGLRLEMLKGPFGVLLTLLFFFHLAQWIAIPLFPLFAVNYLKMSDQYIGIASATFSLFVFLGSSQLDRISRALGNKKLLGIGIIAMGSYPILVGLAKNEILYIFASIPGGIAWAMAGGVLFNYIYEKIPEKERSLYLSWYNLVLNAAVLLASLGGPLLAGMGSLPTFLILFGLLRAAAGIAILIFG